MTGKFSDLISLFMSFIFLAACTSTPTRHPQNSTEEGNWPSYAGDLGSTKSTRLNQINKSNVHRLKVLWRWSSPDNDILAQHKEENKKLVAAGQPAKPDLFVFFNEGTPVAVDGSLYVSTAMSQVVKINGRTGETVWVYNPRSYEAALNKGDYPPNNGYVHRGVTYWKSPSGEERIFIGTGDAYLIALDARTGKPVVSFGQNGRIDLLKGLSADGKSDWPDELRWQYAVTSPLTVCKGVVIVGASIMDGVSSPMGPRGDVRGFDAQSGDLKWTFHTVPVAGEPGANTWGQKSNLYTGNTNVWTMTSADEKAGLVYLPVSTPTNDWYGGKRPGDGLFGDSLVCLECATGKYSWHQQLIHHGLWDYDPPAAPNLIDIPLAGQRVPAVVQVTKQAFAYAFHRYTGEPLWPLREVPVPQSQVEKTSPTQPMPVKAKARHKRTQDLRRDDFVAFDRQGIRKDELINFTPELRAQAEGVVDQYNFGEIYTPPTADKKGTLILPGWLGGASWAGAAASSSGDVLYIPSITNAWAAKLVKSNPAPGSDPKMDPGYTSPFATRFVTGPDNKLHTLPLFQPPYGRVSALDLVTGEIRWVTTMGKGPVQHPTLVSAIEKSPQWKGKDLGWPRRTHLLLSDEVLFAGQAGDFAVAGGAPKANAVKLVVIEESEEEKVLNVLDPKTGRFLTNGIRLDVDSKGHQIPGVSGNVYGAPSTYLDSKGHQIIVLPVGGANLPAELVAVGLPD